MNATSTNIPATSTALPMRVLAILRAPLYATTAGARMTATALFGLMVVTALAVGITLRNSRGIELAFFVYAFGAACLWWLWLSGLLLIGRDARRMRLAGVVRNTTAAAWFYALATTIAPAIVAWSFDADPVLAVQIPALAVAACLAWLLLPRWLAVWFGFLPAIYIGLHNAAMMPSLLDPRFRQGAWLALAILAALDVLRWQRILRGEDNDDSRWSSSMILQVRRQTVSCDWWSIDRNWTWRRARGRKTEVDFRRVGPAQPVNALCVALGGWYVPQRWTSRVSTAARVVLPLLLFIPVMLLLNAGHAWSSRKIWMVVGISGGLWIGLFGSIMLAVAIPAMIQRRWASRADMALAALLPQVSGQDASRRLARAVFTWPALLFVLLWLCLVATATLLHQPATATLFASLFELAAAALMVLAVCNVWAGRPMGLLAKITLGVVLIVLTDASFVVGMSGPVDSVWTSRFVNLLALGWLLLIMWAAWRARRAWRVLQRRPHPFLPNAP